MKFCTRCIGGVKEILGENNFQILPHEKNEGLKTELDIFEVEVFDVQHAGRIKENDSDAWQPYQVFFISKGKRFFSAVEIAESIWVFFPCALSANDVSFNSTKFRRKYIDWKRKQAINEKKAKREIKKRFGGANGANTIFNQRAKDESRNCFLKTKKECLDNNEIVLRFLETVEDILEKYGRNSTMEQPYFSFEILVFLADMAWQVGGSDLFGILSDFLVYYYKHTGDQRPVITMG
nr:hypothetical protein [bacterium]